MGICSSCGSTSVASAMLIMENGKLQEFTNPVRVSLILQRNPKNFVCNAADMEFDDCVKAMDETEDLQIGQLYFALPLSWLNTNLRAQDMASLAVKASLALRRRGGDWWSNVEKRIAADSTELDGKRGLEGRPLLACTCGFVHVNGNEVCVVKRKLQSKKGVRFATTLNAILEDQ
ncbi:hypothetical protein K2173_012806 [Erythroxylum novogranatense]|uniref:Uncharacterized protein n=1 Tax=Erythroxylum novogranatense TaxID=1862640 RepID=A0AAV8S6G0_9ROSI|nr:hypothetical protein K2173_012806 [Erythroxylum novogranatense]